MIDPAVMRAMLDAGCTAEQIVAVAEAAAHANDEKKAAKRANNAERQRRFRERNAMSRVTGVTNAGDALQVSPKKETPPTPPKEKTTPSSSEARASSLNPRGELETVLDAERAKAVVDHRQRIGKPLTAYAAKQLAGKMAKCPDPNAAADEMISNGWQGFKPEWLESRSSPQQRATAPPGRTVSDVLGDIKAGRMEVPSILDLIKGKTDEPPEHIGPTIDAGFERSDLGSAGRSNQLYAFPSGRRS